MCKRIIVLLQVVCILMSFVACKNDPEVEYSTYESLVEVTNDADEGSENKDTVSETEIEAILDVESVLKNVAINFVVGNYAGYQGTDPDNFYLLYDNGKISYIEKDYVGAGGNYRKDMGYSKTVLASKPFFNVDGYKRPLVSKLLSIEKYKNMYEGYVDQVYSYLKDSTVVDEAKKLLGDYTDTDAYKSAEKRLFSYIYRERD